MKIKALNIKNKRSDLKAPQGRTLNTGFTLIPINIGVSAKVKKINIAPIWKRGFQMGAQRKLGFTLVELLVVISIIGLLSSTVFTAMSTARAKARDAQRIQAVQEYKKAIFLSYDANNATYPNPGNLSSYCLGPYTQCGLLLNKLSNPTINDKVDDFLSPFPPLDQVTVIAFNVLSWGMKGIQYTCNNIGCTSPNIQWGTERDTTCRGGVPVSGYTRLCSFTFN